MFLVSIMPIARSVACFRLDDKHLTNEKLVEIQYLDQIMKGHTTSLSVPPNMKNIPQPGSSEKMIQACNYENWDSHLIYLLLAL